MKKIMIVVILLGLCVSLSRPASASPSLILLTWYHTSWLMDDVSPSIFPDTVAFAFSPNYANDYAVYAGTSLGVYKSLNRGRTWENKLRVSETPINSLSVSPVDSTGSTMIAGTEDNILQTTNRWDSSSGIGPTGVGVSFAVYSPNFANDHMIFAGTGTNGIYVKTNLIWSRIDGTVVTGKVTGIVFDPNYSTNHILYVASYGFGVFKGVGSSNLSSWDFTSLNNDLDTNNKKYISTIAISPNFANDQTFFIATDSIGIYKSVNAGQNWSVAFNSLAFNTLLFSPNYATDRTIYAGEDGRGVYRSTDGGATWNQMNNGFADPDFGGSVLTLAFPPGNPTYLFAGFWGGTDGGVWQYEFPSSQIFLPLVRK